MKLKNLIFLLFVFPIFVFGSSFRLQGMYGQYFLPDREFDVSINPALLSRVGGIDIFSDLGMNIMSSNYLKNNYSGNNYSTPTNDTLTLKAKNFDLNGTRIGALMNFNQIGIGILITPSYRTHTYEKIIDPNSTTNNSSDTDYEIDEKWGSFYPSSLLFSYVFNNLSLGFSAQYIVDSSLSYSHYETFKTNNQEKINSRDKYEVQASKFLGALGVSYNNTKNLNIGLSLEYGMPLGRWYNDTTGPYNLYVSSNNSFLASYKFSGLLAGGKGLFEYKIGNDSLFRAVLTGEYQKMLISFEKTDNFLKMTGATNYKDDTTTTVLNFESYFSFSKTYSHTLFFSGLSIIYNNFDSPDSFDNDTKTKPIAQNLEYENDAKKSLIKSSFVFGTESSILKWLTIRGGMKTTLVSVSNYSYIVTDAYDATNSKVTPTITDSSADSSLLLFPSFNLSLGLTFKLMKNFNLDIYSNLDFLGLNYRSDKNEPNKINNAYDKTKQNPVNTTKITDFKINVGISYLL